jgi:hypothetical protein
MTEVVFEGDPCQPPSNPMNVVFDLKVLGGVPRVGDLVVIGPGNASACWVTSVTWELDRRKRDPKTRNWIPDQPRNRPFRITVHLSYAKPSVRRSFDDVREAIG